MKKGIFLFALILTLGSYEANALTVLRDVNVYDGERVDLKFDRGIKEKQIQTDFFRDIIQVSIKDVAVYPAKIFSVDGDHLRKVFAYQYTPNLIRCRLTVKGDARKYKNKVKVGLKGSTITIEIDEKTAKDDKIIVQAAQAIRQDSKPSSKPGNTSGNKNEIKEKQLLQEVLTGKPNSKKQKLTSGKEVEFPLGHLSWVSILLASIGIIFFALRKAKKKNLNFNNTKLNRNIFSWMGKVGLQNKHSKSDINVISRQTISANAEIIVTEIEGKKMILGVTGDRISLISSGDETEQVAAEKNYSGAMSAGPAVFSEVIDKQQNNYGASPNPRKELSVRDRIRQRIEGMKSL